MVVLLESMYVILCLVMKSNDICLQASECVVVITSYTSNSLAALNTLSRTNTGEEAERCSRLASQLAPRGAVHSPSRINEEAE